MSQEGEMAERRKGIVVLVGAMILLPAAFLTVRFVGDELPETLTLIRSGETAIGEVVSYRYEKRRSRSSGSRHTRTIQMYRPVVRFTTADGRSVTFESSASSSEQSYRRGEQVEVVYDPGNPQTARINTFMGRWFGVTLVGAILLASIVLGGLLLRYALTARRSRMGSVSAKRAYTHSNGSLAPPSRRGKNVWLIGVVLLLSPAVYFALDDTQRGPGMPTANGKVISHLDPVTHEEVIASDVAEVIQVVTFNTTSGQRVTFGKKVTGDNALPVGTSIVLRYHPERPHQAQILP